MRLLTALLALAASTFAAEIPRPLPDKHVFQAGGGTSIDLAAYKGKVLAVEFLNTTCPHCQKCSRSLQKMMNEYNGRGFQAIGVAVNEMASMLVPDYVKSQGLGFPVGWAPRELSHEFLQHPLMLIMYVPQLLFLDKKSVIRAQYPGGDKFYENEEVNMRNQIESLLKESAAPAARKK